MRCHLFKNFSTISSPKDNTGQNDDEDEEKEKENEKEKEEKKK